ncbi:elongator complex protein 4 [Stomoxys calcitrans]|uniref:Elongator complex protein 4 n=1 Tax=Stomoxys calcitrans TaxID=35570 RepID=A0A1I8NQ17_STOCA|nr:elongator complex protein 4 [Stomoxys calcitrans]
MSSFRKRNVQKQIPFTRTSPQTGQVITSSGNPSLDVILGGGLPIGSICLIEEDKFVTYSKVLAKYFMAEGILSKQTVFLGSLDDSPKDVILKLPKPLDDNEVEKDKIETQMEVEENPDIAKNGLRIAWRYNDLPMVNSEKTNTQIGHHFNLMEQMDINMLKYADTITWSDDPLDNEIVVNQDDDDDDEEEVANHYDNDSDATYVMDSSKDMEIENENNSSNTLNPPPPTTADDKNATGSTETSSSLPTPPPPICKPPAKTQLFENAKYFRLLKEIQQLLRDDKFHSGGFLIKKSLCRVCITSLASPMWYDDNYGEDLLKFLTILRAAVRSSVSVCFITMPMHLVAKYDDTLVSKIRNLVDYAIELESFAGSDKETNPAFKEYHGLIHLRKITAINTLSAYMPETTDLAFKLRRKKFVIEKLHLPPELQEDTNAMDTQPTLSCGSNISPKSNNSLDF